MSRIDRRLIELASPSGYLTRQRAYDAGISARQLRRRAQVGWIDQVGANGFVLVSERRTKTVDLEASIAEIGGECWASGATAAALHGFDGYELRRPFHVTVMRGRNIERAGVRVHTTKEMPRIDRSVTNGIVLTSPARTVIELARSLDARRLTAALDSGLRDGGFNEDLLHRRIVALRSKGRYGIPLLLDVIAGLDATRGGESWLEREYLRITAAAGLPRPATQQVLTKALDKLVRVDFRYPGTNVVVEVLGYRFHRDPSQLRRDTERVSALVVDGYRPLQFTYEHLVESPQWVVETVRRLLAQISESPHTSGLGVVRDTDHGPAF